MSERPHAYSEADQTSDAGRLADWSAELRVAVGIGDLSHAAVLARAVATVANRIYLSAGGAVMSRWDDDAVQFPRLIAEMHAAGYFDPDGPAGPLLADLCSSMDLRRSQIAELIGRAEAAWDATVAATKAPRDLTVEDLAAMIAREDRTIDGWLAAFQNRLMYRSVELGETLDDRKALARRIRDASEIVLDRDLEGSA